MTQRRNNHIAAAIGKASKAPRAKLRGHRRRWPTFGSLTLSASRLVTYAVSDFNRLTPMNYSLQNGQPTAKNPRAKSADRFNLPRVAAVGAALAGLACASPAFAQDLPAETPADLLERIRPVGVRVGVFEIFPQVSADVGYDNNIYNREAFRLEDGFVRLRPSLTMDADFARHDWRIGFSSEIIRHFDLTEEDSEQATAFVAGRLDLANRITVSPTLSVARRIERRGTFGDDVFTDEPIEYLQKYGSLSIARTGARIEARGRVSYDERDYSNNSINGQPYDLTGRNVSKIAARGALYYEVSQDFQVLAGAAYNSLQYETNPVMPRGSEGYSAFGGVRAQITDLLDAELAVGFGRQEFENPAVDDFEGLDFELTVRWTPKPRIQVTALGSRSMERSPSLDTAAVVQTRAGVALQYALGTRMLLGAEAEYNHDDFRGIDRAESRFTLGSSFRYLINDRLSTFLAGGYRSQSGKGLNAREYDGFSLRAGVTVAL